MSYVDVSKAASDLDSLQSGSLEANSAVLDREEPTSSKGLPPTDFSLDSETNLDSETREEQRLADE